MPFNLDIKRIISVWVLFAFLGNGLALPPVHADVGARHAVPLLPAPGSMVHLSPAFNPPILKGLKVHPDNPFRFDFILDTGDEDLSNSDLSSRDSGIRDKALKNEAQRLI